jgi:alpha-mannosidase
MHDQLPPPVRQALKQEAVPPGAVSVYVRQLGAGKAAVSHHAERSLNPASAMKLVHQYHQKDQIPHALMVFGVGDGGGGPGEEHLERYLRIRDVQGLPKLQMGRVDRFLEKWSQFATKMPVVDGELYFERHQGTYTTEVLNKIGNETMERLLSEYEFLAGMHWLLWNLPVDWEHLDRLWKEVLLYQFHDILPGSSIMPVYEHTRTRYRE